MLLQKHSILRKILLPLMCVMALQAIIAYSTVIFGGTPDSLRDNSIKILQQNVTNRKISLQSNMVDRWSNLQETSDKINAEMQDYLLSQSITIQDFIKSNNFDKILLSQISDNLLLLMRQNSVNGAFLILCNGTEEVENQETQELSGLYFRDLDPMTNPADYSDILLVRGSASIAASLDIRMDSIWESDFNFIPNNIEMKYFYNPISAALQYPDLSSKNLGYWSTPFCLDGNQCTQSYPIITYSIPLRYSDGTPYAVLGIEISLDTIIKQLPSLEIDEYNRGGYMLVTYDKDSSIRTLESTPQILSGNGLKQLFHNSSPAVFTKAGDELYYELENRTWYGDPVYGVIENLNLYNTNTPFEQQQWALLGIANKACLFGLADKLEQQFLFSIVIALLFGIISIIFVIHHTTHPLLKLVNSIRSSDPRKVLDLEASKIREIDELSQVIQDLSKRQYQIERDLQQETERYLVALESMINIMIEYDCENDIFFIYHFQKNMPKPEMLKREYRSFRNLLEQDNITHPDDRPILLSMINGTQEEGQFRSKVVVDSPQYLWFSAKLKPVYDENGRLIRLVGSTRNITEEKVLELKKQETNRRDPLTKLYKQEVGEQYIKAYLDTKPSNESCFLLLGDINKFQLLNNELGIYYCNAILEEISQIIQFHTKSDDLLVRLGGDEFLLFLKNISLADVKCTAAAICQDVSELDISNSSASQVCISFGICEQLNYSYTDLFHFTLTALDYTKHNPNSSYTEYHEIAQQSLQMLSDSSHLTRKIDEIVDRYDDTANNMVSFTFNIFERTNNLKNTMAVLLSKLGRQFILQHIIVFETDEDFFTHSIAFQWNHNKTETVKKQVIHLTESEFKEIKNSYQPDGTFIIEPQKIQKLTELQKRIYLENKVASSFYCSMFDNGRRIGTVAFVHHDSAHVWKEGEKDSLQEIVKIIAAHFSKSKSDLASKAKSEFLSRMSHEIRTPMNAIMGMTTIALTVAKLPDRAKDCLEKIDNSTKYLLSLINDILDMSKIESGKMKVEKEPFSLLDISKDLFDLMQPQAASKKISLNIKQDIVDSELIGDSLRLNQILVNLLGNALKFTEEGGTVTVTIEQVVQENDIAGIYFSVSDTGIGISQENITRIFRAFEQAESSTARNYGGTGLGLAISSNLVKIMGGKLDISSIPNKGSDFHFTLMFEKLEDISERKEKKKKNEKTTSYDFTGRHILLVEDNELNIEIAQTILEMAEFEVTVAMNGQQAIDKFQTSSLYYYDAVLMDIRMPIMDGLEATRKIRQMEREDARSTPIIASSANAFDEDTKKSIESGMNGHLSKPIDMKQLYSLLNKILPNKSDTH